jgi:hypothetical protein
MRTVFLCLVICFWMFACGQETDFYNHGYLQVLDVFPSSFEDGSDMSDEPEDLIMGQIEMGELDVIEEAFVEDVQGESCCSVLVFRVPADYPTIQQAVDAAPPTAGYGVYPPIQTTILVSPGVYHENVIISGCVNVLIIADDDDGEVVIDGGSGSAIASDSDGGTMVALWNLTLVSAQKYENYTSATVFLEFCELVELNSVVIQTQSTCLSVNYPGDVGVVNSMFIGDGSEGSTGIEWSHVSSGGRVFFSFFQSLGMGIYQCSGGGDPELSSWNSDYDSNSYVRVGLKYYFDPDCD